MVCYGGEKDGLGQNGELTISADSCPPVFYAVPNSDDEKVRHARGSAAKSELRTRLAVLAYELDADASTPAVFVMRRNAALDKRVCQD